MERSDIVLGYYLHEILQTKILRGQFNYLVKLVDISTRCSSHLQGKSEVRCENAGVIIGIAPAVKLSTKNLHLQYYMEQLTIFTRKA